MTKIVIVTNKGEINLNLFDDDAPMTVASFLFLSNQGFYNGIIFHRVIADFMIQCGDPLGKGYGGPKNKGINAFPGRPSFPKNLSALTINLERRPISSSNAKSK